MSGARPARVFLRLEKAVNVIEELEKIANEELCLECKGLLTEAEREQGFVCARCINEWMHEATWCEDE
jgi:hypothetical protein